MEKKLQELADKYAIPVDLLKEAIQMEKNKLVYKDDRRRLMTKLEEIIIKYSN
ncbi:hypothetical protein IQ238_01365 [Pleurocapsales cyanobacterium LEGE 06147]|nr:hypothetical protein [Pleurocapsales cyanobacterium LEGE 06147]